MRTIGVDIGDFSVKIVELVQNKKNVFINQFQEKILSQNVSKEDKELEVIEFIRAFVASGDFSQARWILALKQDQVTTRYKSFPFSDRMKIQKVLGFEMEEDVPFDTESCIFDSKLIQTQGPAADILASAIPKNHIEDMIDMIGSLGIEVYALSIEGLAFANLVESWENPPPALPANLSLDEAEKPKKYIQIILNIGHKNTVFTAFENNRLIFTRSLYWGASQIILEIVKKNAISYIEAVKILQTQSTIVLNKEGLSFDQAQTSALISKSVKELARDIQMTILELQSEFNAEVTALHFTGGTSLIPNLGAFLTQQLEVACNPIQLLGNYTGALQVSGGQLTQIESRFSTAVAIGLEGFKKPRNPAINLLKGEFAKQNKNMQAIWENWGKVIQITLIGIVVFYAWASFRSTFSGTLVDKSTEAVSTQAKSVAHLPKKQANETGVKKFIKENKKKINELKLVSQVAQMNSALDVLKKVSESAPGKTQVKLDIMQFTVKDDIVQIVGYAGGTTEINALTQSLKAMSADGVVTSQPSKLTQVPNKTAFNLSFKTDRGITK